MNKETAPVNWHAMDSDEVFKRLDAGEDGLDQAQARQRLEKAGPNALEAEEGVGPLRLLVRQVNNPLIYLLVGAAVLSWFIGHRVDAGVIAGVVVLNTLLGFFQEWRAEGALAALQEMSAPQSRVLRDGKDQQIESRAVAPGDVLVLEAGDRVAADAFMLSGEDLQVDESALTGESDPVTKAPGPVDEAASVADRRNMLWMSTHVTGGLGRAIVIATGMDTEIGRIAEAVRATGRQETPLQKRLKKLGLALGVIGITLAAVVFAVGILRGFGAVQMLLFAVAVAVSAIPEGLPAVISVTLALGVRRMADRHAIVRRLSAVETLGSTTVICSDKTGTITENQMTVRRLWADGRDVEVSGAGYGPEGELQPEGGGETDADRPDALERLLRIGVLSNHAELKEEDGHWTVQGNSSEGALLVAAIKAGMDIGPMRGEGQRLAEIPFSSTAKYNATLHPDRDGAGRLACVKGAPERILAFCSHLLKDGQPVEISEAFRREIGEIIERYASEGLRVMAGADREMPAGQDRLEASDVESGLTFAGLWGMLDPPRKESKAAVEAAKQAGIRPIMITGDHAATALAIARQVGIAEDDGEVLTGEDIDKLDKPALAKAALEGGVLARVSPAHKLKLMEALREQGHVVAMTGDGVNDAPALKGADIGIAMGRSGTEVAKEAADMVLTDDNFATIVDAVEEGRVIYSNLRGVVFFLLCTNAGEILTLLGALVLGMDLPMTATMILWVNLVTAGACIIPLGIEPRHADVLLERPRNPKEPLVNRVMLRRMAMLTPLMALGTLLLFRFRGGTDVARAQTIAFSAMVAFEWFQALNARSQRLSVFSVGLFSNRWLLLGVGTAILLQLAAVHTPIGQRLLGTAGLSWMDWLLIVLVASSIWVADEILKWFGVHGGRDTPHG